MINKMRNLTIIQLVFIGFVVITAGFPILLCVLVAEIIKNIREI